MWENVMIWNGVARVASCRWFVAIIHSPKTSFEREKQCCGVDALLLSLTTTDACIDAHTHTHTYSARRLFAVKMKRISHLARPPKFAWPWFECTAVIFCGPLSHQSGLGLCLLPAFSHQTMYALEKSQQSTDFSSVQAANDSTGTFSDFSGQATAYDFHFLRQNVTLNGKLPSCESQIRSFASSND